MAEADKVEALVHLAGTVAHELNNIFTAVTGNLSLLENYADDRGQNAILVSDILHTANRGIHLSQQLQAFAGQQKLQRSLFDINRSVETVVATLKQDVLSRVDVQVMLHDEKCFVAADEEKFRNVVEELVRNAATAMNGQGWMIINSSLSALEAGEVGRLPAGTYVRLCVRDSGQGMSPKVVVRALDPLFSTKGGYRGWGLARCAGFLRQSGGDILLSSTRGQGTTAEVYLPLSAA